MPSLQTANEIHQHRGATPKAPWRGSPAPLRGIVALRAKKVTSARKKRRNRCIEVSAGWQVAGTGGLGRPRGVEGVERRRGPVSRSPWMGRAVFLSQGRVAWRVVPRCGLSALGFPGRGRTRLGGAPEGWVADAGAPRLRGSYTRMSTFME